MERTVVHDFICLLYPPSLLSVSDLYAFRPTGSTTAALVSILLNVAYHHQPAGHKPVSDRHRIGLQQSVCYSPACHPDGNVRDARHTRLRLQLVDRFLQSALHQIAWSKEGAAGDLLLLSWDVMSGNLSKSTFFEGGGLLWAPISDESGVAHQPLLDGVRKLEWLHFHVLSKYPQCIVSLCHKAACDRRIHGQTERRTELRLPRPR